MIESQWPAARVAVLVVVPSSAAVSLLMDTVSLLAADHRVRTVFTVVPGARAEESLRARGCQVLPWRQASRREFDLVLTTGRHGMPRLRGRSLLALAPEAGKATLWRAGVRAAAVVGDVCYDRLLASIPFRTGYRRAFGLGRGQKLVVVVSAWPGPFSWLLAALPSDRYRVAAVVPPEVWSAYGEWQIRVWLADLLRAGLLLLDPEDTWRAALIAADLVIGDDGMVTRYGAAIGLPVMVAPTLRFDRPLVAQVDVAMRGPLRDGVAASSASRPGEAGELLRRAMYRLLDLAEPSRPAPCYPVPAPRFAADEECW
jgi:hypothetical protein